MAERKQYDANEVGRWPRPRRIETLKDHFAYDWAQVVRHTSPTKTGSGYNAVKVFKTLDPKLILDIDGDPDVMIVVGVGMLIDSKLGIAVDMLSDTDVFNVDTPAINLEFMVETVNTGNVMTDMSAIPITDVAYGTDVDILANENANGLAAVRTPLESTLSSPWIDPMPFSLADFPRWSMTVLDRVRALQACMPWYHVC